MVDLNPVLVALTSGDDRLAEAAVAQLGEAGNQVEARLLELARSAESETRWWAVRALAASPTTPGEAFVPLLNDPNSEVRAAAALALCSHPVEAALRGLVERLSDSDDLVADLAGRALATAGPSAVGPLLEFIAEAPHGARVMALRVLASVGDQRAIPALLRAAEEGSALAQYWAQQGLERLGLGMVYLRP